ncbi:SpoIIE family protein phosphatase [Ahniella affigens]|nr:SpoIIE family protein phosphatase [Ahniella affigens]
MPNSSHAEEPSFPIMLELIAEAGPQAGQKFVIAGQTVLGRGQFADLVISDLAVSRRHAEIEPVGNSWRLKDLESANGTRHNGKVLLAPVPLLDGDTIELGQTRLRVRSRDRTQQPLSPEPTIMETTPFPPSRAAAPPIVTVEPLTPPTQAPRTSAANELYQNTISRLSAMTQLGEQIADQTGLDDQLNGALASLAEAFPRVEAFALLAREAAHRPWRVLCKRVRGGMRLDEDLANALASAAVSHAQPIIVSQAAAGPSMVPAAYLDRLPCAVATIPVRSMGNVLGALFLASERDPLAVRASDRAFMNGIAGLIGAILTGNRHAESERLIHPQDIDLSRRIQQRFLPAATPRIDGYEIADNYTAARIVGGDLFDFLTLGDGRIALMIGDVSGKGMPAALYMARVGAHARAFAPRSKSPADLLTQMQNLIRNEMEAGMFITVTVASLDPARGLLKIATAGHPPPLIRRVDGSIETPSLTISPALGTPQMAVYTDQIIELNRGDGALFFTDGLDEAQGPSGDPFGLERVKHVLAQSRSAGQTIESLLTAVGQVLGDVTQYDDLTMIALYRR